MSTQNIRLIPIDYESIPPIMAKKNFASIIGIHRNTVTKYNKFARLISPEYREDDETFQAVTKFQFWVLWHVQLIFFKFPRNSKVAKKILIKNREELTKNKFKWAIRNHDQETAIQKLLKGVM